MIHTVDNRQKRIDHEAISYEQIQKRRIARRRRVAKRMAKRFPLMAVEFMQNEFPGYTYSEFEADVLRKTRKGKSFRRPKTKRFDWARIKKEIPAFFYACRKRAATSAELYGKLPDGTQFHCIVRATWYGEYGDCKLNTSDLIKLFQGSIKAFLMHPAMVVRITSSEF